MRRTGPPTHTGVREQARSDHRSGEHTPHDATRRDRGPDALGTAPTATAEGQGVEDPPMAGPVSLWCTHTTQRTDRTRTRPDTRASRRLGRRTGPVPRAAAPVQAHIASRAVPNISPTKRDD